jgi:hypothetical protein
MSFAEKAVRMAVVTFIGVTSGVYIFTPIVDNLKQQVCDMSEKQMQCMKAKRWAAVWGVIAAVACVYGVRHGRSGWSLGCAMFDEGDDCVCCAP